MAIIPSEAEQLTTDSFVRAGMTLDLALYLDSSLRWEIGLSFFRLAWLQTALIVVISSWLVRRFFARFRVVNFVQAILTFPLWCWAFYLASTGNPHFDWRALPVADFFRVSLLDAWLYDGGFLTAAIAAAATAALAPSWRYSTPRGKPRPAAQWRRGQGWAMLIAAGVALLPIVSLPPAALTVGNDPRDPTGHHQWWLQGARLVIWSLVAIAGVWRLRRGLAISRAEA